MTVPSSTPAVTGTPTCAFCHHALSPLYSSATNEYKGEACTTDGCPSFLNIVAAPPTDSPVRAPEHQNETLRERAEHVAAIDPLCTVAVGAAELLALLDERDALKLEWDMARMDKATAIAERNELAADLEKVQTELDVSEAERAALRASLEEAGKDSERLDWLETACAEVRRPDADTLYVRVPECVRRNADGDCTRSRWLKPHYGNARHAIDSARLASTETEQ